MTKQYIGDGVYVEVENGMLKLTTSRGGLPDSIIFLEKNVYAELVRYAKSYEFECYANRPRSPMLGDPI